MRLKSVTLLGFMGSNSTSSTVMLHVVQTTLRNYKQHLLLGLIIILAAFLRFYHLGSLPYGFHRDEVLNGYVGRFTLQNGVDLYSNTWPILYFDNFGDYPNILPMYISGLSTYVFGINEFAVRFPIALAGVLSVVLIYLLANFIFQKQNTALFASFLVAIQPWHIVLSRATAEGVLASTTFLLATILLFYGIAKQKLPLLLLSFFLSGSTYLLYPAYRVLVPIILLPSFVLTDSKKIKTVLITGVIFFFILTLAISQTTWGRGRFDQTTLFSQQSRPYVLIENFKAGMGGRPLLETRIFHNKIVLYGRELLYQYLSYFSGDYLFSRGGMPQRYQIPDIGLIYYAYLLGIVLFLIPSKLLKLLGIKSLRTKIVKNDKWLFYYFLLYILLVAPLASVVTQDDVPNVHRSFLMSVTIVFPIAYVFTQLFNYRWQKKRFSISLGILISFVMCLEFIYFWQIYTVHSSTFQTLYREDDKKPLLAYLDENQNKYDHIYLPSEDKLALYYLFDKRDFNSNLAGKFQKNLHIDQIGKLTFIDERCVSSKLDPNKILPNSLIINRSECQAELGFYEIARTKRLNSTDAYTMLVYKKPELNQ
ncbi:phospholipid carrier-dependent glycosyltransferase [Candidatus Beckwithbacteria bacterium]|nr:phospholipid carrier-dependent glycosyltransferase [Candidatus Beckwithbacteria bacterium]